MDPAKVDQVVKWKIPTNRDLLHGLIGSAGYLVDDIYRVWIPLGVLLAVTGDTVPFHWTETEQCTLEKVKHHVQACATHHRMPLVYGNRAPPVWFMTDACLNSIAGVVTQGTDWKSAKVAVFLSTKLNTTQQNYPVHEQEMLTGVEGILHHQDILQGAKFVWLTDHKIDSPLQSKESVRLTSALVRKNQ